jgi:ankyrin repeat protein
MLDAGADCNLADKRGWTPLMMAANKGCEKIVEMLIDGGADVSLKDKFGKQASDRAKSS